MRTVKMMIPTALVLAAVGTSSFAAPVHGQDAAQDLAVSVDDPRPLAAAIREVESRYGWAINYEDPLNANPADAVDVIGGNRHRRGLPPAKAPRGGALFFTYDQPAAGPAAREAENKNVILMKALEAYDANGYPGKFEVRRSGGILHVVPTVTADPQGKKVAHTPMLDATLSLPAGRRNSLDVLSDIAAAVSARAGVTLFVGAVPVNLLANTQVDLPGREESAREALLRVIAATNQNLSWQLFCTPTLPHCALNLHGVTKVDQE